MTFAFTFDAAFCSGCKACQAACKDKNNLPLGVLWRRVFEVTGGTWQQNGEAWNNTVFAYNLSIACNHCLHPKCVGVCPTNAYLLRDDGIVLLDTTKCMGCGYCSWACPYGVPQYNNEAGYMTKCNLCFDNLEQGLPPACVAACPLRVLDFKDVTNEDQSRSNETRLWETAPEAHPFPLPDYSRTQPRIAIKQHAAMSSTEEKFVANLEEVQPRPSSMWEDVPLILFTLLIQMAVGGFWIMTWFAGGAVSFMSSLFIGACLGAGMLISFSHLGTKRNAWRALSNLRKSRLSREILFLSLFALGWLFSTLTIVTRHYISLEWMAITSILGIGLIHNMAEVYRLPAAPDWNTWRTNAGFMVSALLLGLAFAPSLQPHASNNVFIGATIVILLFVQFAWMRKQVNHTIQNIRIGLIFAGMVLTVLCLTQFGIDFNWMYALLPLIVVAEEVLGRWLFYRSRM